MTASSDSIGHDPNSQTQVDALIWTRVPHPSWQEELDRIAPPADMTRGQLPKARAVIWWEAGDEWEPIQRWFIYQVLPKAAIHPSILAELEGPHPRSKGRYSGKLGCWVDGPAPHITKTQWELYRKFGGLAKPYWVLQGSEGGHRYELHKHEKVLLHHVTGRKDVHAAGDLPACEPDQRTWQKLWEAKGRHDEVLKIALLATKYRPSLEMEDAKMVEEAARTFVASWGERVAQHADELAWAMRRESGLSRTAGNADSGVDDAADEAEMIHELMHEWTGTVPKDPFSP